MGICYINDTMDRSVLEITVVELLDGRLEICQGFVFHETVLRISTAYELNRGRILPSTIAIAADFRIDNVQSRLAGEIFQVLEARVSPVNPVDRKSQTEREAIQVHKPEIQMTTPSVRTCRRSFSQKKTGKRPCNEKRRKLKSPKPGSKAFQY